MGFSYAASADLVSDKNNNAVNGIDLEVLLETAPIDAQKELLASNARLKEQLEQLYLRKAIASMAVAEGLDKDPMVAARMRAIVDNAMFMLKLDALKKSNTKDYSKYAKILYQVNKEKYPVEARVDTAHILISTKSLPDKQALAKAQKIRSELLAGADFATLALKESDDKSAKSNKGQLGVFTRDKIVKPFADAAFAMQEGELSMPVKTRFGYHIIKLNKKMPAGVKSFAEVKGQIISRLKAEDWKEEKSAFFKQVLKDNEMEYQDKDINAFVGRKLADLKTQE